MGGTSRSSWLDSSDNHAAVGPAKTKRIGQRNIDLKIAGLIGAIIQITLWILIEDIDGRGRNLVIKRQRGEYCFNAPCRAQQMSRHGFGGVDDEFVSMLAKRQLQRFSLVLVAQRRRRSMRIHIGNLIRINAGIA